MSLRTVLCGAPVEHAPTLSFEGLPIVPWLSAAVSAPSAHNSQPWVFSPGEDGIGLGWDRRRELPHGDPRSSYLLTGLGAAAESIAISAAADGVDAQVRLDYRPEVEHAAWLSFSTAKPGDEKQTLATAIPHRQTTRLPFGSEQVPSSILQQLVDQAALHDSHLTFVSGEKLRAVADLTFMGTARNLADAAVYGEFYGWLRVRSDDPGYLRDGLTVDSLSLGRLRAAAAPLVFPPSRMRFMASVGLHRPMAAIQARLVRHAPIVGLLTGPGGDAAGYFAGGRALLRVWLAATAENLRFHPMTASMDHEETRIGLADVFGIPRSAPMVACFRLGFGPPGPRSARLPVEELIVLP